MLVLSRKQNEAIVFSTPQGEEIVVRVVRVNGDKVRLGIECDKNVSIHREEVFNEIKRHAELMDSPKKELENEMDLDNLGNLIVRRSHLELLMGAINNMTVVANGEGAIITTDDGVTKQNWDIKPTKSNFDALGDDEDGCGPDGNYVDQ